MESHRRQWLLIGIAFIAGIMVSRWLTISPVGPLQPPLPKHSLVDNEYDDGSISPWTHAIGSHVLPHAPSRNDNQQVHLWYGESDLEVLPHMLGPRDKDIHRNRSLVVIIAGSKDAPFVNATVHRFLDHAIMATQTTFMLFHWDNDQSIWSQYGWYHNVIRLTVAKQMKWWYYKRFLHPAIVEPYEYIWLVDADLNTQHLVGLARLPIDHHYIVNLFDKYVCVQTASRCDHRYIACIWYSNSSTISL
jgi:hypothetical protein